MISNAFSVDPWSVHESELDVDHLPQTESLFALSNGHVGMRANLDEGEPHAHARDLPQLVLRVAAAALRRGWLRVPGGGQTLVNAPNGKLIRLLVDDEPLDVRYGDVLAHHRTLDFRAGLLTRARRLDLPQRPARRASPPNAWSVLPARGGRDPLRGRDPPTTDPDALLVLQSELFANEQMPEIAGDPRVAAALKDPLVPEHHSNSRTARA